MVTVEGMSDDLAIRNSPAEMASAFEEITADIVIAFKLIQDAEDRFNKVFTMGHTHDRTHVRAGDCHHEDEFNKPDRAIARLAREAWKRLAERLELRQMMSTKAYDALEERLEKGTMPEITEQNVRDFAQEHWRDRSLYLDESIKEVFEYLRPRRGSKANKYKTNSQEEIPPQVILTGIMKANGYSITSFHSQPFLTMERVFSMLDGAGEISKAHRSPLETAIGESNRDPSTGRRCVTTRYFAAEVFRNGNVHLSFRDLKLLAALNRRAGGMNLRPKRPQAP